MKSLPSIAKCCVEPEANDQKKCLEGIGMFGAFVETSYHQHCPGTMNQFQAAFMDVLPVPNHAEHTRAVTAVEEKHVNIVMIAATATVAGAVGASVAMAVAWWSGRKQDVLLAN
eukprot:TRINITY_DN3244_c0_g1_i2.p1 TRINITY_DN3244_c0_g1~~TRINITY_DN3244_c0_g1_i2.p1  ORF type:complete len:131 (+),score=20.66 TRINITY_DN3244_c0_g1_i2:54-395(+)